MANRDRKSGTHLTPVELRQMIAGYYGLVALVDGCIGQVLDALKRLELEDDTIVVFTADHGDQLWEHRLFLKFVFYEASVHVRCSSPAKGIKPGDRAEFVEHVDLFPTICDLTGTATPQRSMGVP